MPLYHSSSAQPDSIRKSEKNESATYMPPQSGEIENLIDSVVARHTSGNYADQALFDEPQLQRALAQPKHEKLILLSRAFSGLVDLLIVILAGSSFLFAVDIIEGIEFFDTVSLLNYFVLLIATFFVYSMFFLATASQTIGMMITDLRVTGMTAARPRLMQLFTRCATYLLGLLGLGIGLLWGCFDRQNRCFHDSFSSTRVVRVLS